MAIALRKPQEIEKLRSANKIVGGALELLAQNTKVGISLKELDAMAEDYIRSHGARPSFKGLYGFPNAVCTSLNQVIIHGIPTDYKLEQNYPNPFNPTTSIRFELPRDKAVSLTIFDVSGRIVKTLVDNQQMAEGAHEMQWDGTNDAGASVASGTYLYRLSFGNFAHTKTMVFLK